MRNKSKNSLNDLSQFLSLYRRAKNLQERIVFLKDFSCEEELGNLLGEYIELTKQIDDFFLWYATLTKEEQDFIRYRFWEGLTMQGVCSKMLISEAKAYKLQRNIIQKWEVREWKREN
jgi:DNA-directed RNA polymerase sigma subunit (sigma70/sigma32)